MDNVRYFTMPCYCYPIHCNDENERVENLFLMLVLSMKILYTPYLLYYIVAFGYIGSGRF